MMALVSVSNDNAYKGKRLALFAALDCLLAASTAGTITPLFFALSLISYFVSGSKTIISYLSSISIIGCDGLPYLLSTRLLEEHENLHHILLQPGLGHFEINMTKACFRLLWDVGLSELGKMLGFNSIKAQSACKSANDHHKTWQMITIFFEASADELLVPYIRQCICDKTKPSLNKYHEWLESVCDPNYIFMTHAVFTYLLSLFLFRTAVRRNNYADNTNKICTTILWG